MRGLRRILGGNHCEGLGKVVVLFVILLTTKNVACLVVRLFCRVRPITNVLTRNVLVFATVTRGDLGSTTLRICRPLTRKSVRRTELGLSCVINESASQLSRPNVIETTIRAITRGADSNVATPLF